RLCAPWTLLPRGIESIGGDLTRERTRVTTRLEEALDGADVVMMLRVQNERMSGEAPRFPNPREFSRTYGLSARTLAWAKPDAVDGISFEVPRGVVYGVLGPNGAGKSTTLRMLNDIIAPDRGEIRLLDRFRPGREAAPHIGYLPEERGLYPKMRVVDMLS